MHLTPDTLSAYADGELEIGARREARAHLDACVDCRGELAHIEKMTAYFAAGPLEPDAQFEDRVLAKLRSLPLPRQSLWGRLQSMPLRIPALSAAALVIVGLGGYTLRQQQLASRADEMAAASNAVEEISVAEQAEFLENVELLEDLDALEALDDVVPG